MIAASWPREEPRATRLLHVDAARQRLADGTIEDLRKLLRPGDLLVVNDAATLPASLRGVTAAGAPVELRLAGREEDGCWRGVLFGAGDWRTRTEDRPRPPRVAPGEVLRFDGLRARIERSDRASARLVWLRFGAPEASVWRALYRSGHPVQYAHTARPLSLWHVQTAYGSRPWAVEAPSAGFPLTWDLLLDLRRERVGLARVTHAAGLSSSGEAALDARFPLPERYDIPADTVREIESARRNGGRVIAVGTSVTRALEGASASGRLAAGAGTTDLLIGPGTRRNVVDAVLTGVHEPGTSHFALLEAFVPRELLVRAHAFAEEHGYRGHEFGDAVFVEGLVRQR